MCYQIRFIDTSTDEEIMVKNSERCRIPSRGEVVLVGANEYKVECIRTVYEFGDSPCYTQVFLEKNLTFLV